METKLMATALSISTWPPAMSSSVSANSCMNELSTPLWVLLTGSKIAAPDRPMVVVASSPANSAPAMISEAARPRAKPMAVSARKVAGVMTSVA
jgi:hypothetical protein